jgi:hypothetical protein
VRVVFVCAAFLMGSAPAFCTALRAGTAKWGYEDRLKPATGTLDPLYARVFVLEVGEKRLALVTLDLGRSFGAASLAELREAARRSGICPSFRTNTKMAHPPGSARRSKKSSGRFIKQ